MSSQHGSHGDKDNHHGSSHIILPFKVLISVWIALLIGTVITVAVSYIDFGSMNMIIAMLVATIKASLVMMFFMGLKYDTLENSITFLMSFLFLAIFITLTSFDVFWRPHVEAVVVDKSAMLASSDGPLDVRKLATKSTEAMDKGKVLFSQTCAVCHGVEGKGDGPGGLSLNPKPRNFTLDAGWKNGRKVSGIFKTLAEGIKGGGMASYAGLSVQDRFALSHYVQSLGPAGVAADSDADLAALGLSQPAKPELSVAQGMDKLVGKGEATGQRSYVYEQGKGYILTGSQDAPMSNIPRTDYCKLPEASRPKYCP